MTTPKNKIEAVIQDVCGLNSQIAPRLRRHLRKLVKLANQNGEIAESIRRDAVNDSEEIEKAIVKRFKNIFGVKP